MIRFIFLFSSILACNILAQNPERFYRSLSETLGKSGSLFTSENSFFSTTSRSNDFGNEVPLTDNESYFEFNSVNSFTYGISSNMDLGIFANYRYVQTDNTSYQALSYGGLKSAGAKVKYSLGEAGGIHYSLIGRFNFSINNNEYYTANTTVLDDVSLGDDVTESQIGFAVSKWLSNSNVISLQGLYNYRGSEKSSEVLYKVEDALAYENWAFKIGVEGIYSMGTDPYSDFPTSRPVVKTGGVTYRTNSVNRERAAGYLGIDCSLGNFVIGASAKNIFYAVSNDYGNEFLLTLSFGKKAVKKDLSRKNEFKSYEGEGRVIKISPQKTFIKVDKGVIGNFEEGMNVDIFDADYFGKNLLVARGVVHKAKSSFSIIRVLKTMPGKSIKKHMVARSY